MHWRYRSNRSDGYRYMSRRHDELADLAVVVVSVASRREDRSWTLAGPAQAVAGQLVCFHATGIEWLRKPAP
jgi:hypothetical protein